MADIELPRDVDIRIATLADNVFKPENGDHFVLTGSYSIEALTGHSDVTHNDIDANVFTTEVSGARSQALRDVGRICYNGFPELIRRANTRLDYEWPHGTESARKLELQFIAASDMRQEGNDTTFILGNDNNREILVPTTMRTLQDSTGRESSFRVKTLPYAVATWALRISGIALNQKRMVRDTDIAHFAFLLSTDYDETAILHAVKHHPQMPDGYTAGDILSRAYDLAEQ